MLTFFTTAKPFLGHDGVIQRNALKSWTLLRPDVEVILFGDDAGAAEAVRSLGIRHEPQVERNERGSKRLDNLLGRAQAIARHNLLCYINCDIILMQDFCKALARVNAAHSEFLMVGRRWDTEVNELYDFEGKDWETRLQTTVLRHAKQRTPEWIDYFAFTRGLYADVPPLVIGRVFWDNWLLWKARNSGKPVVDASDVVLAVHQNHDYRYHPQGKQGVFHGEEAGRNYELAGGWRHLRTIADADEVLREGGLKPNRLRHWAAAKRYVRQAFRVLLHDIVEPAWFFLLEITRPLRRIFGVDAGTLRRLRGKVFPRLGTQR
jgi:hypothetical protein